MPLELSIWREMAGKIGGRVTELCGFEEGAFRIGKILCRQTQYHVILRQNRISSSAFSNTTSTRLCKCYPSITQVTLEGRYSYQMHLHPRSRSGKINVVIFQPAKYRRSTNGAFSPMSSLYGELAPYCSSSLGIYCTAPKMHLVVPVGS